MLEKKKTPISGYETAAGKAVAPHVANRNVGTAKDPQDLESLRKKSIEASRHLTQIQEEQKTPAEQLVPDVYLAWKQRAASRILRRFLKSSPNVKAAMAPGLAPEIESMASQNRGKEKRLLKAAKLFGKISGNKGLTIPKDWDEIRDEMVKQYTQQGNLQEAERIKEAPETELYKLYTDSNIHIVIRETLLHLDERDAAELRDALAKLDLSVIKK